MEFMRDGGWGMWLLVVGFIATLGFGFTRQKKERPVVFLSGTMFILMAGMLGMATGMVAVSRNYDRFPDKTAAVAQGLGELSNNGTLAANLAFLTGIAALVTRKQAASAKA